MKEEIGVNFIVEGHSEHGAFKEVLSANIFCLDVPRAVELRFQTEICMGKGYRNN
jgi:hypothetical protein